MRYNEQVNNTQPKKTKKQRELPKAGSYTVEDVKKSKDTPWRK
jgi:hypothetical protein